jgi:hypothetical protein
MILRPALIALAFLLAPALASAQERPAPPAATGVDPAAHALATRIVDLGYPPEQREALFFATMDQTVTQMRSAIAPSLPSDDPAAIAILDQWILDYTAQSKGVLRKHIPDIMDGMITAYAELFTRGELADILAFVETPSGKRYFELSPAILGAKSFADANQAYLDESLALLGPAQQDLRARLEAHLARQRQNESSSET